MSIQLPLRTVADQPSRSPNVAILFLTFSALSAIFGADNGKARDLYAASRHRRFRALWRSHVGLESPVLSPPIKRSPADDVTFFTALENGHPVSTACRAAGYAVPSVYRWRSQDAAFATQWKEAITLAGDILEEEADRRGRDGIDQPVYFRGKEVGQKRRYSDPLLLARLKAIRPEHYRDRMAPAAPAQPQPFVLMRDFALENALVALLQSGKITFADLNDGLRPRLEKLMAAKDLDESTSM